MEARLCLVRAGVNVGEVCLPAAFVASERDCFLLLDLLECYRSSFFDFVVLPFHFAEDGAFAFTLFALSVGVNMDMARLTILNRNS